MTSTHERCAESEVLDQVCPRAPGGEVVRFVNDQQVECRAVDRLPHLGSLDEIDRRDDARRGVPRVHSNRQPLQHRRERHVVEHLGGKAEAVAHLFGPLLAQRGRREHEHAPGEPAHTQLGRDEDRLNRLAEAHFIREEDASRAGEDGSRRFELPGAIVDSCRGDRTAVEPWRRLRRRRGDRTERMPPDHVSQTAPAMDWRRAIEWDQDARGVAVIALAEAAKGDDTGVGIGVDISHHPRFAADVDRQP